MINMSVKSGLRAKLGDLKKIETEYLLLENSNQETDAPSSFRIGTKLDELEEKIKKLQEYEVNGEVKISRELEIMKINARWALRSLSKECVDDLGTLQKLIEGSKNEGDEKDMIKKKELYVLYFKRLQHLLPKIDLLITTSFSKGKSEREGARMKNQIPRKGRKEKRHERNKERRREIELGKISERREEYQDQVQINIEEEDKILKEIKNGMDELYNVSQDMNGMTKVQGATIDQLSGKMDQTQERFKKSNAQIGEISTSGTSHTERYCCLFVLGLILLVLIGTIISTTT